MEGNNEPQLLVHEQRVIKVVFLIYWRNSKNRSEKIKRTKWQSK